MERWYTPVCPMRILYAGLPSGALALRARGHEIALVLLARSDRASVRRLADGGAAVLVDPDLADDDVLRILASARAQALVSFFWPRRLPAPALGLAPVRLGVHPSLLPRHRGADPIFWTILRGDTATGVSVHEVTEEIDAGKVLRQREIAVPPDATGGSLWRILRGLAILTLGEVVDVVARGEGIEGRAQDGSLATAAPLPTDDDLEIRWDRPASEILRLVRAASPDPGAFSALGGETITILAAGASARRLDPGDAIRFSDGIHVGTATTAIRLLRWEGSLGSLSRGPSS